MKCLAKIGLVTNTDQGENTRRTRVISSVADHPGVEVYHLLKQYPFPNIGQSRRKQDEDKPFNGPTDKGKDEDNKDKLNDGLKDQAHSGLKDQAVIVTGKSGALEEAVREGDVSGESGIFHDDDYDDKPSSSMTYPPL